MTAILLVSRMARLRLARGRARWFCAGAALLPVLLTLGLAAAGKFGGGLVDEVATLFFRLLVLGLPGFLAASAVADEMERRTFTFLFTRPVPRSAFVLGQLVTIFVVVAGLLSVAMALTWGLSWLRSFADAGGDLFHLLRLEAGVIIGTLVFTAFGLALGLLGRAHAFLIVVLYLLFDVGVGLVPFALRNLSLSWHVGNLAGLGSADAVSWTVSLAAVSCLTALALLLARVRVRQVEP